MRIQIDKITREIFKSQFEKVIETSYSIIPRGELSRFIWDGGLLTGLPIRDGSREGEILFTEGALYSLFERLERADKGDDLAHALRLDILYSLLIEIV